MSRVKLKFPEENPLYTATVAVRIGDINYGGHVGNDSVLSVVHEARVQFLDSYGYTEIDIAGTGLIMADVAIVYKGESFYKDVLKVEIYATDVTNVSFDLMYRITTVRDGQLKEIAHAKTGMVCFDYKIRKVTFVPDELKTILKRI